MLNQKQKRVFAAVIIFCAVFVVISTIKVKAGTNDNVSNWAWGGSDDGTGIPGASGLGWISMNNTNSGGGLSYGVNIPLADADLFGYAWSENLGWISFNRADLSGCPSGICAALRVGNTLSGWARVMSIAQAGTNAGGWLGWIKLKGSNYGITIAADGKLSGYAWSDELGYISFRGTGYGAKITPPPTVTLNANPFTIDIKTNSFPIPVVLGWTITDAVSCTKSGNWSGTLAISTNPATGTETISQNSLIAEYALACSGPGGNSDPLSGKVTVSTACYHKACGSGQTCDTTPQQFGISDPALCDPDNCSSDNDCLPKEVVDWKEVSP